MGLHVTFGKGLCTERMGIGEGGWTLGLECNRVDVLGHQVAQRS